MSTPASVRLDVWLDVTCLFKTRSAAQKACRNGKIEVNGQPAKPHRTVSAGDEIRIGRPFGSLQTIIVRGLGERHVSKTSARALYEDRTPPPSPAEIEARRLDRQFQAMRRVAGRPDKRHRRLLRRLKGQ